MTQSTTARLAVPALDPHFLPQLVRHLPESMVRHAAAASYLTHAPRDRILPRYFLLWLQVAAGIFSHCSITQVIRALIPGFAEQMPSSSVIAQGRSRLGWLAFRQLAACVALPIAKIGENSRAFYRGLRLVGIDGTSLAMADTPSNDQAFGRAYNQVGASNDPRLRRVALCELGTHVLFHWIVKPFRTSELRMSYALLSHLQADQLLLHDCAFFGFEFWQKIGTLQANLLGRAPSGPLLKAHQRLSDGSYLSRIYRRNDRGANRQGIEVRVIAYCHQDPKRTRCGKRTRLVTTLLDAEKYPARELIELYHQRWEQELAFDEIKTHLNGRDVELSSKTPVGVLQEVWGLILGHWVLRSLMVEAGHQMKVDPLDLSFMETLRIVQMKMNGAPPPSKPRKFESWWKKLLNEIGKCVLRKRRDRIYPRVQKKGRNKFPAKRCHHQGQLTCPFADVVIILN